MAHAMEGAVQRDESWTARMLGEGRETAGIQELARMGTGAGLASLYGMAIGARDGGLAMVHHALGVPAALLALAALGVPALWILSTLLGADISATGIARAASKASVTAGLVLAGLAPIAALYVVTSDSEFAAKFAAISGLLVGGAFGVRALVDVIRKEISGADVWTQYLVKLLTYAFVLFAALLEARVWSMSLPMLTEPRVLREAHVAGAR